MKHRALVKHRDARAGERHQLVGHQMNEQVSASFLMQRDTAFECAQKTRKEARRPSSSFLKFSGTAQKTCKNIEKWAFWPLGGSLVQNAQPLRKLLRGRARNLLAQRSRNAVEQLA